MTLIAHSIGYRSMDIRKKDSRPIRAMGIMARRAVCFGHRIIHVLFDKSRIIRFMAFSTESDQLILQEVIGLCRPVGIVAVEAAFFHGIMLEFHLRDGISQGFVAAEAEFVPRLEEIALIIRTMGIVALDAITLHGNLMTAFRLFGNDVFMALEAGFIRVVIEQFAVRRRMGIMAFGALPILHWCMDKLAFELFLKLIVAIETKFSCGPHLQFVLILLRIRQ